MSEHADRVAMSTISFRSRPLEEALAIIARLGAVEAELGAIPAVTDHVPVPYRGDPGEVVAALARHGLRSGAVNSDVGDLNDPTLNADTLTATVRPLVELAATTGGALIVPCGRADWTPVVDDEADLHLITDRLRLIAALGREHGVRLLVEVLHHRRYVHTVEQAERLLELVPPQEAGLLFDVSHVVASGEDPVAWARLRHDRIERVHLRDAVAGDLNLGIGRGEVDFDGVVGALERAGFDGTYVLELETHDIPEDDREDDARRSRSLVVDLLEKHDKEN